jgi:hypothetical protein
VPKFSSKNDRILGIERERRLARLLPESDYGSDEMRRHRRAFLLENEYRFDDELSEQYQRIKKLSGIAPGKFGAVGVSDDDLRFGIGEIVYKHMRRFRSKDFWQGRGHPEVSVPEDYFENLKECMRDAELARPLLEGVISGLSKLDGNHWAGLNAGIVQLVPTIVNPQTLFTRLRETSNAMVVIKAFAEVALGSALPSGGRGQPKVRYVLPAAELLVLWFRLTGQAPVTTITRVGNDFVAPSSQFTKLCLTMIQPTISLANVATSITRSLDALDYMIEIAGDHPIQTDEPFWLRLEQAAWLLLAAATSKKRLKK